MRVFGAHNKIHSPIAVMNSPSRMLSIRKNVAHFGWKIFSGFKAPGKRKISCLQIHHNLGINSPRRSFEITSIRLCRKLLLVGVCLPMILLPLIFCGTVVAK